MVFDKKTVNLEPKQRTKAQVFYFASMEETLKFHFSREENEERTKLLPDSDRYIYIGEIEVEGTDEEVSDVIYAQLQAGTGMENLDFIQKHQKEIRQAQRTSMCVGDVLLFTESCEVVDSVGFLPIYNYDFINGLKKLASKNIGLELI
jgi:hypothetical protein